MNENEVIAQNAFKTEEKIIVIKLGLVKKAKRISRVI